MKWVLQDNTSQEAFYPKLLDFLERMDLPYQIVKAVPFTGDMIPEPVIDGPAIALGSYSFTNKAIALGWKPGSWTNENFDYRKWSVGWAGYCLNEPALVTTFGNVPFQEKPFFIRPCADDKLFTGTVMDWGEFIEWQGKVINLGETYTELSGLSPVVVAEAKKIVAEWRFIVVDRVPVTGSLYKSGSIGMQLEVKPDETELLSFVQKMADIWVPARVFALDIALSDGEYKVLEMGNFNSAGLYKCDIQKIVMALESMECT